MRPHLGRYPQFDDNAPSYVNFEFFQFEFSAVVITEIHSLTKQKHFNLASINKNLFKSVVRYVGPGKILAGHGDLRHCESIWVEKCKGATSRSLL